MDEANPYASPRCHEPAPATHPESQEPSAWRDGDVLVVRRSGAQLPRACVKSNRCHLVARLVEITLPGRWLWLLVALLVVPLLGPIILLVVAPELIRVGRAGRTVFWIGLERAVAYQVLGSVAVGLIVLSGFLLVAAWMLGSVSTSIIALICFALGLPFPVKFSERLFLGLRFELADPNLTRIHGAHPEYLKRLTPMEQTSE